MAEQLRAAVRELMPRAHEDLTRLVALRSVADARQFPPEECAAAAAWVVGAFREQGFADAEAVETSDGSAAVIGFRPGPADAPTVLLYCHYDVQPPGDEELWNSPPFTLTERDGRWYGRGASDCKGNLVMHLTALRALAAAGQAPAVNLRIVAEGSEEMGTGGLEDLLRQRPELFDADVMLIADTGNTAVGEPTITTSLRGIANVVVHVSALEGEVHSGVFGGPAPDAMTALVQMLATLHDEEGNTTVDGLVSDQHWNGVEYDDTQFRGDAGVLEGVDLVGSGSVADQVWARPALTILGIDCPPVVGSAAAITPRASARLNLRVPPGTDPAEAQDLLIGHLLAAAPWGVRVSVDPEATGMPFGASAGGPGFKQLTAALSAAYGAEVGFAGQGGSIPLCSALAEQFPDAEIALIGVEEPQCRIHAPNESVDPSEIENLAYAEALFLSRFESRAGSSS
ncbi:dipeptidase [Rhodococcus globerulus]|uniref:dipeptidase n=1 Tax=Rhodococcus globerulus TaxID=33008 RepID=UPI001F4758A3|nr:dipeptidase [Rhodococcus globerulus]MCE4267433.1 dipeptidase [Rhodococcus globerulus]